MYIMSHTENGETKHSPLFVLSFRLMAPRKLLEAQLFNKQYHSYEDIANIPVYDLLDDYNRFIAVGQGKLIREHRESLNLGKRPYARTLGVDTNMIRLWESERKQISLKSWEKYFKDRITV